jgi:hypothetical protein
MPFNLARAKQGDVQNERKEIAPWQEVKTQIKAQIKPEDESPPAGERIAAF